MTYLPEFRDAASGQHLDELVGYQPWPAPRTQAVSAYMDDADAQDVYKPYDGDRDPVLHDTDQGITP